jgi:LemA protein
MAVYILIFFILASALLISYTLMFNRFQEYIIRINEAEANIDSVLRKRFDLLNKSINIIGGNIESDEEILPMIVKLRSRKLTNFELDRLLYEAINEFNRYKDTYPELKTSETFVKIDTTLLESELEIYALRKYYNDTITEYNKLVTSIPTNLIARFFKYKIKTYFDGKDMTDEVVNDFKL